MAIWNFSGDSSLGIQDFNLQSSNDGVNFNTISGASFTASQAISLTPSNAELFHFTATSARFIRMNITSNHGADNSAIGELAFIAVPEPGTYVLFLITAIFAVLRRKR